MALNLWMKTNRVRGGMMVNGKQFTCCRNCAGRQGGKKGAALHRSIRRNEKIEVRRLVEEELSN